MPLTLTLAGSRESRTVDRGTLSIGRAPGNDWVLADPERHLSKTHCFVAFAAGRYVLTDVSTNGVFINGARESIGRDNEATLNDGDEFRLGEHVIRVTEVLTAHVGGGASGRRGDPLADAGDANPDPFGADPLDDPFGAPAPAGFRHNFTAAAPALRPQDPFDRADESGQRRPPDPDDDLFHGITPVDPWQGPSQSDHVDAPAQAFAAPKLATPMSFDDIDALLGDLPPDHGAAPPPPARPAQAPRPPVAAPPAAVPPASVLPPADPFGAAGDPFDEFLAPAAAAPTPPPPPAPAPVVPVAVAPAAAAPLAAPAAAVPAGAASADGARLLAAFLEGAGVPGLATGDPEAAMREAGLLFRAMVEGLRQVLISRAAIKNEFRVEQTMLRARDNNPIKFSVTDQDAIAALLSPGRPGYKPPLASTQEAFDDVRSHEMAVMAGVQTALMGLLRRFEPAALEKRLAAGMLDSILPAARKARTWELFCGTYQQIVREAEDDFQSVFGREFARAYHAQVQKL
jgi:type VI secretion system FHA domain protein